MTNFTQKEYDNAIKVVTSTLVQCEKMQFKFKEGTSQYSLLKNRIKALYIAKSLLLKEDVKNDYSNEELNKVLAPIDSIINKCVKGRANFNEGTSHYNRFDSIVKAMILVKSLLLDMLN